MFVFKSVTFSKSLTGSISVFLNFLPILNYNSNLRKMGSWEVEKKNYLSQDINARRKNYNGFVEIKDVPTWTVYAKESNLLPKANILPENIIDESKNQILADKISVFAGDITKLEIDAIVNAANKTLLGGGGVDGCIHRAAGAFLKQECSTLGGCNTGEAKITGGYKLPSKYVIHTVGPIGEKPEFLANCYRNSLKVMLENNLKTIAFPCISTGIYGYPNLAAAHVAIYAIRKELEKNANKIDRVIFCLFLQEDIDIYQKLLQSYFPIE